MSGRYLVVIVDWHIGWIEYIEHILKREMFIVLIWQAYAIVRQKIVFDSI